MARSLRSKRRKHNKQILRARYKPIYDKRLEDIVKNMQKETEEALQTAGDIDLENNVHIIDPEENKMDTGDNENKSVINDDANVKVEKGKIKIPRVDIKKLTKFMSQRKLRSYQAKLKAKKKATKMGQKKKKVFKW